ncbi:hypothetical protein EC902281_4270, partial [Escherichia coli 90.2281]
LMFNEIFLPV